MLNSKYLGTMRSEVVNWMNKMVAIETIIHKYLRTQGE